MKHFKYLFISLVMIVSLLGCGSGLQTPVRSPDALHTHISDSTAALVHFSFKVQQDKESGEIEHIAVSIRPHCTSVWISKDEMVTAAHCVVGEEDADPVGTKAYYVVGKEVKEVLDDPAAIHKAQIVAVDVDHDVALLKADAGGIPEHSYADFATEMPALGEHVYSVGHPKGMYYTHAEGTVSAYRGDESSGIGKVVQVNATIWFGNSGGGVFDYQGRLVGICSRLTRVPMMNYFVHLDSVKRLVKDYHTPAEDLSKKK
jgi:hypothetical protein